MRTLADIIPDLISRTRDNLVDWLMASQHGSKFILRIGNQYEIEVRDWLNEFTGEPGISLNLKKGDILIDEVSAEHGQDSYLELKEIFSSARRNALKVEEALRTIDLFLKNAKLPF